MKTRLMERSEHKPLSEFDPALSYCEETLRSKKGLDLIRRRFAITYVVSLRKLSAH